MFALFEEGKELVDEEHAELSPTAGRPVDHHVHHRHFLLLFESALLSLSQSYSYSSQSIYFFILTHGF